MKKVIFILVLCTIFSCKKNNSSSSNSNNSNNGNNTNTTVAATTFSVDGKAIANLTSASFKDNNTNFGLIAYGANSTPELQILFGDTLTPVYGTYQIILGTITYGKCSFTLTDTGNYTSTATTGYVNVVTSNVAPKNVATFTNISVSGGAGNHTISGTITY